jgi:hypothetical protein
MTLVAIVAVGLGLWLPAPLYTLLQHAVGIIGGTQ